MQHLVGQSERDGIKFRSSCPDVVCKKVNPRNFAKFTEKHLCQSLFFNTDAGWGKQLYLKKAMAQVLSCEFCEISMNTFSYGIPQMAAKNTSEKFIVQLGENYIVNLKL